MVFTLRQAQGDKLQMQSELYLDIKLKKNV